MTKRFKLFVLLALSGLMVMLTGCRLLASGEVVTVLAGSELRDLEPLLDEIAAETGVRLQFEYIGTLNGAEALLAGHDADLAWFSHGKYLTLLQSNQNLLLAQEKIMLSPVVLGVKESKARELGWLDSSQVTWQEIAERAGQGDLRYAMTNPASSNSGFTALVGVAAALADSGDVLESGDVNQAAMQAFFHGQALTAGSSGWLADSYVESQADLDGMINYESVLLQLNASNRLAEPLVPIYPQEGIITADYPLMLLAENKREQFDTLVTFLRSPDFQQRLMETTLRRPAVPRVGLNDRFPSALLIELPFPNRLDVINSLLFTYLDEQRIPAHAFFVLDVSGSMSGDGLRDLKFAMNNLTGLDDSLTGQFARFRGRERVSVLAFSDEMALLGPFFIDNTAKESPDMEAIRQTVAQLEADGGTAIYSALIQAYELAHSAWENDPERYYSIVLMSDGENTDGWSDDDFRRYYNDLPPSAQNIRTFTVAFGAADEDAMSEIAELTNGRFFDSREDSLSFIFKQIRGYQ
ncbi:MAG: substrate-binding domain-containing protein [Chloroflexota bacterium]